MLAWMVVGSPNVEPISNAETFISNRNIGEIIEGIKKKEYAINYAYQLYREDSTVDEGMVVYCITIEARGIVSDIQVVESCGLPIEFTDAVMGVLYNMKFTKANGGITFNQPFTFKKK